MDGTALPAFGRPTGFVVNYSPDRAVKFDLTGKAVENLPKAYCFDQALLSIGGRAFDAALQHVEVVHGFLQCAGFERGGRGGVAGRLSTRSLFADLLMLSSRAMVTSCSRGGMGASLGFIGSLPTRAYRDREAPLASSRFSQ
jgi:hypothetical protein